MPEGCTPEFNLMSRRPGIGSFYLKDNPDVLDKNHVFLSDQNGSIQVSVPKFFIEKLKLTDPDRYDNLLEERKRFASDREFLKLQSTSLSYIDLLELEEKNKLNKTQILFNRKEV